jgi:7-keto-8-aminopelargonate synthetase-like enzyme
MEQPELVTKLQANAKQLRDGVRAAGFDIGVTETPIVPITIGDERKAVAFWKDLLASGVYTNAVIFPAVPRGGAILRTSTMATHNSEQLDHAIGLLTELGRKHKLIP